MLPLDLSLGLGHAPAAAAREGSRWTVSCRRLSQRLPGSLLQAETLANRLIVHAPIYIYTYIHKCAFMYTYTWTHIYIYICFVYACIYIHTQIHRYKPRGGSKFQCRDLSPNFGAAISPFGFRGRHAAGSLELECSSDFCSTWELRKSGAPNMDSQH